MSNQDLIEFRLEKAEQHIEENEVLIRRLESKLQEDREYYRAALQKFKDETAADKKSQLIWGVSSLGSLVMILAGIIWSYRAVIFKGSS